VRGSLHNSSSRKGEVVQLGAVAVQLGGAGNAQPLSQAREHQLVFVVVSETGNARDASFTGRVAE
jgi:hypothetical protein